MRVVFMGTPEFAVASLDAICHSSHEVAAVVTAPDKPAGRGLKLRPSAVKTYAVEHQLPLLQPEKLKDEAFLAQLRELHADIFVVVAFRMLPEAVYAMPPQGTFNVHASLLPNYRGAAPIHWAVMNGETRTGVTTFFLDHQIDTGDIIDTIEVPIGESETTGELYDRLMACGAELAVRTLDQVAAGTVATRRQADIPQEACKPAPKIFKEDTFIDWSQPVQTIFNKIRGLSPVPGACTRIRNAKGEEEIVKIFSAEKTALDVETQSGVIEISSRNSMLIFAKDGAISVNTLQFQGKNRMPIADFLRGFHPENYQLLFY
ncbi:MAG: methionyl-tRNA formyltransferase [Bacteroidales bacterium]|nr:methionyl-tRNA formyltransferase [Bacteroidales bacterium]